MQFQCGTKKKIRDAMLEIDNLWGPGALCKIN